MAYSEYSAKCDYIDFLIMNFLFTQITVEIWNSPSEPSNHSIAKFLILCRPNELNIKSKFCSMKFHLCCMNVGCLQFEKESLKKG